MTTTQVVKTPPSLSEDYSHPDDHARQTIVFTLGAVSIELYNSLTESRRSKIPASPSPQMEDVTSLLVSTCPPLCAQVKYAFDRTWLQLSNAAMLRENIQKLHFCLHCTFLFTAWQEHDGHSKSLHLSQGFELTVHRSFVPGKNQRVFLFSFLY